MSTLEITREDGTRPCGRIVHESWGALLEWLETPTTNGIPGDGVGTARDKEFYGTKCWEDTLTLAREGWHEGAERVQAIAKRLETSLIHNIVREDVNYDVEGMSFDVARYLTGEPEHWVRQEESTMAMEGQRHVKVVVNTAVSGGVERNVIETRGAVIAALVNLLEFAGHRVELWVGRGVAMDYTRRTRPVYVTLTRVKAYDQPLDIERVAFAVAHVAMARRINMAAHAHRLTAEDNATLGMHDGTGYPADLPCDEETSLYMGKTGLWEEWTHNPASAERWILSQLQAQGVTLRED